jgi:phage/plasmid-associated DNA primase
VPSFPKIDEAIRGRIVIHEFPNTFTDDLDLINSNPSKYKMKDIELKENCKEKNFELLSRISCLNIINHIKLSM